MNAADPNSVRKSLTVDAPQAVAWRVFTEKMSVWWPLSKYKIGAVDAVEAIVEPKAGGRWYERGVDGSTCDWGTVRVWEPTSRLVLTWDISADWAPAPGLGTEVEVRFVVEDAGRTRVDLEHRGFDRYGPKRDQMRRVFDSEGDWGRLLQMFANVAVQERE